MASPLKTPGLKFFADPVIRDPEGGPRANELYIVCKDGSIQSVYQPDHPIGWELIEDGDEWYYGPDRKRCIVRYHSRVADPPEGRGYSGSVERPQKAEITEQKDQWPEVTSFLKEFRRKADAVDTTTLNGDLKKISTFDPRLAQCAAVLNDPAQTEAMAKFAEGKMSYAEMRALCG